MELTPFEKKSCSPICCVGKALQNGVRIEKHHSLLLRLSCIDIVRASDWDLKQSIRKLDSTCSTPIHERIDRVVPKGGVELHLIYENSSSVHLILSKIELLMNKIKANGRLLDVEVISGVVENNCTKAQKVLQAVWLRNLPIRWFELDSLAVSCAVPNTHMLRIFLTDTFGDILLMETRNQNSEKENSLRCDVCLQFAGDDGRNKMMNAMSDGSCIARKEGSEVAFPITAEFDMEGYFEIRSIDQRVASRESLIAAQKLESKEVEHLKKATSDAEIGLNDADVLGLLDVVALKVAHEELKMLCIDSRSPERNSLSLKGDLDDQISMAKQQCKSLRAAAFSISSKCQALMQLVRAEQVNRKLIAQKEAAQLIQMHIKELQSSARHSVDFAIENSRLGKKLCFLNNWENIPQKLFPRMDILTTNVSQLLKKEGGGEKYANMLQKSQSQLEECIAHTAPIVTCLEQYSDLLEAIKRAESSMSIDEECDSSVPEERSSYPVANTARECMKSLIQKGTESMSIFLSGIRGFEMDSIATESKEDKQHKDTDTDTAHVEHNEKGVSDMAHAIDVLRGVHARLLDAELTTRTLVDSYVRVDVEGKSDSPSIHEGVKKGQFRCSCFKGSCICDSEELKQLHGLYLTEIVDPFELRISRISNMLRSPIETVTAPSFLVNLKNSVETACALSLIGAKEYEQDREVLMKEADLIRLEEEREKIHQQQIAEENKKRVKAEQRALLEKKIAALKERKRELEEIEEEKNRRDNDVTISTSQVDLHQSLDNSDIDHTMDTDIRERENGREIKRERGRGRDVRRDSYEEPYDRYSNSIEKQRQPRQTECEKGEYVYALLAPSWDIETLEPSVPTSSDRSSVASDERHSKSGRSHDNGTSSSSRGNSRNVIVTDDIAIDRDGGVGVDMNGDVCGGKRSRMHSVVGCVVNDTDSGILSATRRRLNLTGIFGSSGGNYRESESAADTADIDSDTHASPLEGVITSDVAEQPIADQNVDVVVHREDLAGNASTSITDISQQNKQESTLREALLASKLKKRLSARIK